MRQAGQWTVSLLTLLLLTRQCASSCYNPFPPYPPPSINSWDETLQELFKTLDKKLATPFSEGNTYFSVELTSQHETLWSFHHTATKTEQQQQHDQPKRDVQEEPTPRPRRGVDKVDGNSAYRIASVTKVFTVLAAIRLHEEGKLSLDEPITTYVSELDDHLSADSGGVEWEKITLRSLASQLSGVPRESMKSTFSRDLAAYSDDMTAQGFPDISADEVPTCHDKDNPELCTRKEFVDELRSQQRIFEPNFKSTYSNIAFVLVGMAVENVTGVPFNAYIESSILDPLNMTGSSLEKPDDSRGVIPDEPSDWWGFNHGFYNATGGLYSTSSDLSRFLRYILNSPSLMDAWLKPHSWASDSSSFYGMPWEIYHSDRFLPHHGHRPTTFYTKSGGIPGYVSNIILMPEQGVGITILVAGDDTWDAQLTLFWIRDEVTGALVPALEDLAQRQLAQTYAGVYDIAISTSSIASVRDTTAGHSSLNSSISLAVVPGKQLHVVRWISNGTDFLQTFMKVAMPIWTPPPLNVHIQLLPSRQTTNSGGEVWRAVPVVDHRRDRDRHVNDDDDFQAELWDNHCLEDVSRAGAFGGRELNEIVFTIPHKNERENHWTPPTATAIDIPALRVRLERNVEEAREHQEDHQMWSQQAPLGATRGR